MEVSHEEVQKAADEAQPRMTTIMRQRGYVRKKRANGKDSCRAGAWDFEVRTDLAVEEGERFPGDGGEISVFHCEKWRKAIRISV